MVCFGPTLLILLLGFTHLSAAQKDTCDLYAAPGDSLTLPFAYDRLTNLHVLRWTHNNTIIFYRQQGSVSVGKQTDISPAGSLLLKKLQVSSAGVYQANVLNSNGTLAKSWTGHLCMMQKVAKPKLSYNCDFKTSAVKLNCQVANPQDLLFSWALDEKTLPSETKQQLSISLAQLKGDRTFTCTAANRVSKEKSDTARPVCKSPTPPAPALLCFPSSRVVAVLAGGAGLILLLVAIIIALCCSRRRNKEQIRKKGELRMLSLSKRDPDSVSREYETMHPTEHSPPLSPKPTPRACYESVSQPEAQAENRPPAQLSKAAEGQQQPSPVPMPRTKSPQTANK